MNFNNKQNEAINSNQNNIVIKAPPGSGKTHTMVGAISHFIERHSPNNVVAVTFTRKAAKELKDRLPFSSNVVQSATIHSWSYRELEKLSQEYGFRIRLMQEDQIKEILSTMIGKHGIYKSSLSYVYSYITGNYNMDITDWLKNKYKVVQTEYIAYKEARNLYDFMDLPLYLLTKLKDTEAMGGTGHIDGIDALFVDEFQDVDPVQLEIFQRVRVKYRFYIGDPHQSIYLFRGAVPTIFDNLNNFELYELDINYRSYQEILNLATSIKYEAEEAIEFESSYSMYMLDRNINSDIKADRGYGGATILSNRSGFITHITGTHYDSVQEALTTELEFYDYNILCRKNKEVKEILKLGFTNVTTVHQAKGLEYDNILVIDFNMKNEEDINIAYVATTRAKDRLIVTKLEFVLDVLEKQKNKRKLF